MNEFLKRIDENVLRKLPVLNIGFVDAVILLGLAAMLAYVTQLVLVNITGSEELKRRNYEENFMLSGLNCLAANSEIEFDHCVARSACENPEKAMTLVSAAKLVPGYTGKYEGLVNIVNRAASKGLDGENCDYLSL